MGHSIPRNSCFLQLSKVFSDLMYLVSMTVRQSKKKKLIFSIFLEIIAIKLISKV